MLSNDSIEETDEYGLCAKTRQLLATRRVRTNNIPTVSIFLAKYSPYPCFLTSLETFDNKTYHVPSILNYLMNKFDYDSKSDIVMKQLSRPTKQYLVKARLSDLKNGVMIFFNHIHYESSIEKPVAYQADYFDDFYLVSQYITIYYLAKMNSVVAEIVEDTSKMVLLKNSLSMLQLLCRNMQSQYYLDGVNIRDPVIHDLALHYGSSFIPFHDNVLKQLSTTNGHGIVLLHGIPGSGKTHYIRYLISKIKDKRLVYVPIHLAKDLTKPEVLGFLTTITNSILIIEDAENVVRDRNDDTFDSNQAVSNLLNISDGLLSDALSIQIVATFNSDLKSVDAALLRPGRLIGIHEFNRLSVDDAKALSNKLGLGDKHITNPMTLAEIYNYDENNL